MTRCGSCGGGGLGSSPCTCFVEDSSNTDARGNGSMSHPFQFHPNQIPEPRPFGYIRRTTGLTDIGNLTWVSFDTDDSGIEGNMADLATQPTRLTAPVTGVYLAGGSLTFGGDGNSQEALNTLVVNRANVFLTATVTASNAATLSPLSFMSLIFLNAGDFIEMNPIAVSTQDIVVVDSGRVTDIIMWAHWVGEL